MGNWRLKAQVHLPGTIECITGTRIGGSKDEIEIGGIDNPIIRDPVSGLPYIPGSSLKGKLRSMLEYKLGKVKRDGKPCYCTELDCDICRIFGTSTDRREVAENRKDLGPTRIIVRDAQLTKESVDRLQRLKEKGINFAEAKQENSIDRTTGKALNPRTQERSLPTAKFDLNIHLRVFDGDDADAMVELIKCGLKLIENDALGGSGSRGYGWVKFHLEEPVYIE